MDLPERFDLESEDEGEDGLDTPSPRELLDLVPFFFKKFLMVAFSLNAFVPPFYNDAKEKMKAIKNSGGAVLSEQISGGSSAAGNKKEGPVID